MNDHAKTIIQHFDSNATLVGYEIQRASDGGWCRYWAPGHEPKENQ